MMQRQSPRRGGLAVRILGSLAVLVGLGAMMYFTLPEEQSGPARNNDNTDARDDQSRRCEEQLADIFEALGPGRLGISADRAPLIDRLNSWKQECGALTGAARPSSDTPEVEKLLEGDALARALSDRFLLEDAFHIRMSLLARDIVSSRTEGKTSSADRAVSLFSFVSRNVMLINDEIRENIPMTPYESLVFGMGTPEDRAWIFAELLRQTRTDVVILTPQSADHREHWLIGVIDSKAGVLLFDPRLGLPIPAADDSTRNPFPQTPATLADVLKSDAAFRKLDIPHDPYPLHSGDLKDVHVELIGTSSNWSPRMALLQFLLPPGVSVDLYEGLGANELRSPGLVQRVTEAGQQDLWKPASIAIWSYPETQEKRFEATRGQGKEGSQLANFQFVFRGPYTARARDPEGKDMQFVPIARSLHFVRLEQLRGKHADAIRDFLPIRTATKRVDSPANQLAAEYATLWTGVSQCERQQIRVALGTLDRFVRLQAGNAGVARTAIEWIAQCLLIQKNYKTAADLLKQAPAGFAPRRDQFLARRWYRLAGVDPDHPEPEKKKEEKKTDEKSETGKKPAPESSDSGSTKDMPQNGKSQKEMPKPTESSATPAAAKQPATDAAAKPPAVPLPETLPRKDSGNAKPTEQPADQPEPK